MTSAEFVALTKSGINTFRGNISHMLPWRHVGSARCVQSTIGSKKFAIGEVLWMTHKLLSNIHVFSPSS
ncbi:hypothetical protein P3T22_003251 [Paraburkholderia sp. GAS348]|jgi:hypothetical protein